MSARLISTVVGAGIAAIFGLTILLGSWYTIDQGELGVVLRNGAVVGTADAGLHLKTPFITSVEKFSTRTQKLHFEKVATYSKDQQPTVLTLSVNYHIDPGKVGEIYSRLGAAYGERVIWPAVYTDTKNVFGQFDAVTIVQERAKLNLETTNAVADSLLPYGILVEAVQIENVDFSSEYEKSIEARMAAAVAVERAKSDLAKIEVDAQQKVKQAEADALATRARASAEAYATEVRGKAEATAINAKGAALRDNPALVNLTTAERWNGALPATMVPSAGVPFLNVR
jgi:regulator of protease activity HflC (stomatin/prohibitin superfamily)